MLSSWQVNTNEEASKSISFNPVIPAGPNMGNRKFNNEPSRKDYETYGWLFGANKRSIY